MATALHNLSDYDFNAVPDASNMIFGVVVAEWNPEITGALLEGCVTTLEKHGALPENIHVKTVPGSSNIPVIYGLLTTNDLQQAKDRAGGKYGNKGDECAVVAIKMAKF